MGKNGIAPPEQRSYLAPFVTMVVMMTIIGFVTSINQQFQAPIQSAYLSRTGAWRNTFTTLIIFSFFLAYPLLGPSASRCVERHGYKMTIVRGLLCLCGGILLFIVSALLYLYAPVQIDFSDSISLPVSYFLFLLGSFVCGAGITYMQSSVNPYLIACDVRGTTPVQRQNIGGVGNSTMTMLAPLFVSVVIFGGVEQIDRVPIRDIVLPMSILLLVILGLSYVVRRLHVPHIEGSTSSEEDAVSFGTLWRIRRVRLGVIALFCYVGVEVCIGGNIVLYARHDLGLSYQQAALYSTCYWLAMLIGRIAGSFLNRITDRTLLIGSTVTASLLVLLAILLQAPYCLIAVGLCHSVMWGAIYSLALKDLGPYTARASGILLMGLIGGALIPFLQSLAADLLGAYHYTWLIVLGGELYMLYYAVSGSKVYQDNPLK